LPADPHVVLTNEALAAEPSHGNPIAPRWRDEASDPAVARALAVVAYVNAGPQIRDRRDVDGVHHVVVAGARELALRHWVKNPLLKLIPTKKKYVR
jgi:hypothetical protein